MHHRETEFTGRPSAGTNDFSHGATKAQRKQSVKRYPSVSLCLRERLSNLSKKAGVYAKEGDIIWKIFQILATL